MAFPHHAVGWSAVCVIVVYLDNIHLLVDLAVNQYLVHILSVVTSLTESAEGGE